ncbi:MAG: hypothetical protein RL266_658 [Bacteroidota bacterium]|jgi:hypothetical protein
MTGGAGFSRDAMNRSKSNRSLRTSNKSKFKEGQVSYSEHHEKPNFKEVSEPELNRIKQQIREKALARKRKNAIIAVTVVGAAVIALVYLLFLL